MKTFAWVRFLNSILFIIVVQCLLRVSGYAQESYPVQVKVDKNSAGSAYKSQDDVVFLVESGSCRIEWTASRDLDGKGWLKLHRDCELPFVKQAPLHRAVLREIQKRWKLSEFRTLSWGSLCGPKDWNFCLPIAKASLDSKDYQDYRKHYPHSKLKALNGLFVELANQTQAYRELSELLAEFGVKLRLKGVEKVFALPLKELPFYEEMKNLPIQGNPRLMYDAGMNDFELGSKVEDLPPVLKNFR